jgi:hypothetical protein
MKKTDILRNLLRIIASVADFLCFQLNVVDTANVLTAENIFLEE